MGGRRGPAEGERALGGGVRPPGPARTMAFVLNQENFFKRISLVHQHWLVRRYNPFPYMLATCRRPAG